MIGLDTNVVARWILRDVPSHTALADAVFGQLTAERPGFVTQVTMVELLWVMTKSYGYPRGHAYQVLEELLISEDLEFDDGESIWAALLAAREGADFADALIAETFRRYGCEDSVTFDRDAARRFGMRLLV